MSMQARTLKILQEADFTPPQALALAEAIEGEIAGHQPVTISILDVRLERFTNELRREIQTSFQRCLSFTVMFGLAAAGLIISATTFLILHFGR